MKKTIAILLILVIGMVGVFAEAGDPPPVYENYNTPSTTLILQTYVDGTSMFAVTKASHSNDTFYDVFGAGAAANNDLVIVTEKVVSIDSGISDAYLTIGTNLSTGFSVEIGSAEKLSKNVNASKIDYTISVGSAVWNTGDTSENIVEIATVTAKNSAKVESYPIDVEIDAESFYNAEATLEGQVYSANVVFKISTT